MLNFISLNVPTSCKPDVRTCQHVRHYRISWAAVKAPRFSCVVRESDIKGSVQKRDHSLLDRPCLTKVFLCISNGPVLRILTECVLGAGIFNGKRNKILYGN